MSWSASSSSDIDYYEVYTSNSSFSGTSGNKLGNTSGTSFSHTGLGSEDRQYYRVFAVDDAGNRSGQSNQVNAKTNDTVAPSAPGISLSSGSKSIAVSLSRPDGDVNRYDIYRSTSSGSNGSVVKTLNTTAGNPSWTDGSVSEDTRYYYRAKARDDAGNYSGFSGQKSAVPTDTWNPAAPTNLNASASGTSISLSWSASGSSDVTRYDVYASNNSFSGTSVTKIGNTSSTGFTESGLSSEEQRYYRVVAVDDAGNSSGTSNLADARTADVQAPSAPGISLTQRARAIEVELGKPSADTESYTIYRSTSSGTTGSAVKTITSTNSSPEWTDNSVSEDTRYYYSARATDDAGNTSSLSNQVNEVPGDTWSPAAPASVTASGADNAITVSWDASVSGDVAEYEVYGATSSFTGTNASLLETTSSTSVTQNGLDSEQTVYYRIVAVDDDRNTSDVSNIASATTNDTRAPSPISTLTATAQERAVKLTWSKPSSDAVSYEVYRSASSTDPGSVITTVTSTGSSLEYVDSDVNEDKNEDKEVYYVVQATDDTGNQGSFSNQVSATPIDTWNPDPVGAITTTAGVGEIQIEWSASPSPDIVEYEVYASGSSFQGTNGNRIATVAALSYVESNLGSEETRFYRVFAVDDAGNRAESSPESSATTVDTVPPDVVDDLTVSEAPRELSLSWSKPASDATSYEVFRSTSSGSNGSVLTTITSGDTNLSYADSNVEEDVTYFYRIRAADAAGNTSPVSDAKSGTPVDTWAPDAPAGLTATAEPAQIALEWSASPPADFTGYAIYRAEASFTDLSAATKIAEGVTEAPYTDTDVSYGQDYFYRVTANDDAGNESPATDEASASPVDATPPAAPSGIAVTDETTNLVSLSWSTNNEGDLVGYNVYATSSSFSSKGAANRLNSTLLTETAFDHSSIPNGQPVYYRITAVDGAGNESALSAEVTGTPVDETAPEAPSDFIVSNETDEEIALTWSVGSEPDLAGYNLYRSPNSFSDLQSAQRLNGNPLTASGYVDDGLTNGETYYYRLTAVDGAGNESAVSAEVVAEPRDNVAPDAPTALGAEVEDNSALLEWTASTASDVEGYYVYRSTASFSAPGQATRVNAELASSTAYQLTGLTNGQAYALRVTAVDASGNESDLSAEITLTPEDTTPPEAIAGGEIEVIPGEENILIRFPDGSTEAIAGGDDVADYDVYYGSSPFSDTTAVTLLPGTFGPGDEATIDDLDVGETVYIRIVPVDDDGLRGPASDEQERRTTDMTPPAKPAGLTADVGETSVALSWEAGSEADLVGYHVYRAKASFSDSSRAARISEGVVTSAALTDSDVQDGQRYFYRVVAIDTTGNQSNLSDEVDGRPIDEVAPDALGAPALVAGSRVVDVSFAASSASDVVGYNVYRALSAFTDKANAVKINDGLLTERSIRDDELINGKKYFYRVTAVDDVGNESALGAIASTIPVDDLPPGLPEAFTAEASDGVVSLSWKAGGEADLDGYKVYRATVTTPPGVDLDEAIAEEDAGAKSKSGVEIGDEVLVNSEPAAESLTDSDVENDVTYRYRIAAVDTVGNESNRGLPIIAQPIDDVFFAAPTVSGTGDGGTWNDAAGLQSAIESADEGDAIWLEAGTYTIGAQASGPDEGGDAKQAASVKASTESVFTLPAGVKLYGGFSGKEGSLSERDSEKYKVIITADVDGNDERAAGGITEIAARQEGGNAAHVITVQPGDPSARTVIDGVTLTAGQATGGGSASRGGAVYCDASGSAFACNIELANVTVAGNAAQEGGAIFVGGAQSTLDLVNVQIGGSQATAQGGAIALAGARGRFANVVLHGNKAGQDGGAIYFRTLDGQSGAKIPTLYNATIAGNTAGRRGGAIYAQGGSEGGEGLIVNSILHENDAPEGAVVLEDGAAMTIDHAFVPGAFEQAAAEDKALSMAGGVQASAARFVDDSGFDGVYGTLDDDFRLKPESKAIGAGSNEALVNDWIDLDGDGNASEPLPIDARGNERLSAFGGDEPVVDLGAIEQHEEVIPILVEEFGGESDGRIPTVTWNTTQEINNAAFELQREDGGGSYTTIATIDGSGTTSERVSYSYTDKEVPYERKETRYRLRQVDEDGTSRLLGEVEVAIEAPETLELFGNYPNPFQQSTVIRYRLHRRTHVSVSIYNEIGQRVAKLVDERQRPGRNEIRFNGASMPSGLYFVRLEAGGERITRRMVLVR